MSGKRGPAAVAALTFLAFCLEACSGGGSPSPGPSPTLLPSGVPTATQSSRTPAATQKPTPTPLPVTAPPTPTPSPTPTPNPNPTPPLQPPPGEAYLGAYVNPEPTQPAQIADIMTVESQIGRTFALSLHYYSWSASFPGAYEANDATYGRVPVESWDCKYPDADIAAGKHDSEIQATAQALKSWGRPVFVRYLWEMNIAAPTGRAGCLGPDDTNGFFNPADFIAAWQHIYGVFAKVGATNVVWLWCPSGDAESSAYYPGKSYVDWAGFDKYDVTSIPIAQAYADAYTFITSAAPGKPIMLAETGFLYPYQATAFPTVASTLLSTFPNIRAWVYYDGVGVRDFNWTFGPNPGPPVNNPPPASFITMSQSQFFSATAPP